MIDGCDVDLVGEVARNGGAVNADDTARSVVSMAIVDFSMVCCLLCSRRRKGSACLSPTENFEQPTCASSRIGGC